MKNIAVKLSIRTLLIAVFICSGVIFCSGGIGKNISMRINCKCNLTTGSSASNNDQKTYEDINITDLVSVRLMQLI